LSEEERQKIKDLLFILEKFNVSEFFLILSTGVQGHRTLQTKVQFQLAFDLNSFIFLDLLFSVFSENSFPLFAVPTFSSPRQRSCEGIY
jgi:hypothetical protein